MQTPHPTLSEKCSKKILGIVQACPLGHRSRVSPCKKHRPAFYNTGGQKNDLLLFFPKKHYKRCKVVLNDSRL